MYGPKDKKERMNRKMVGKQIMIYTFTDPRAPLGRDKRNLNKHTTITLLKNSSKGKNIEGSRGYTLSHKVILTDISNKAPVELWRTWWHTL